MEQKGDVGSLFLLVRQGMNITMFVYVYERIHKACHPVTSLLFIFQIWSYGEYSCSDGAVEEFYAQIQTNEGLKGASVVTWGNSNGVVGYAFKMVTLNICPGL